MFKDFYNFSTSASMNPYENFSPLYAFQPAKPASQR